MLGQMRHLLQARAALARGGGGLARGGRLRRVDGRGRLVVAGQEVPVGGRHVAEEVRLRAGLLVERLPARALLRMVCGPSNPSVTVHKGWRL